MTIYDALMVGVVVGGTIWGAMRGITWQLAGIASLVLGYAVAFPLSGELSSHFPGEPVIARGLAMLVIYLAVSGGVYLAAWLIRATLKKLRFEAYDRHLGMMLGGAQGALLGIVATVFVVSLSAGAREPILTSHSGQVVSHVLDAIQPALPGELRTVLTPFWEDSATSTEERLADAEQPTGTPRGNTIPTDPKAALDWLQDAVPGADSTLRQLNPADPAGMPVDRSVLRSVLEVGAEQFLNRAAGNRPVEQTQTGTSPANGAARGQSYWWEEDGHGRESRRR